jgi:hypothetical protein
MNLQSIIPRSDMPRTRRAGERKLLWLDTDSLEEFQRRGGHPLYGEGDVTYSFNSHGYRCPEFEPGADVRMISIGCSNTLGVGLPQQALFHEQFAERLRKELSATVVNWNLSMGGASNDYICRTLYLAVPQLNPHIVLVNFTYLPRREYVSVGNRVLSYIAKCEPPDRVAKEIYGHIVALSSPLDDQLNLFQNYKAIESLLHDRLWLYSFVFGSKLMEDVAAHTDPTRLTGHFSQCDYARDGLHPGPRSHEVMYASYWNKFVEMNGPHAIRNRTEPVVLGLGRPVGRP